MEILKQFENTLDFNFSEPAPGWRDEYITLCYQRFAETLGIADYATRLEQIPPIAMYRAIKAKYQEVTTRFENLSNIGSNTAGHPDCFGDLHAKAREVQRNVDENVNTLRTALNIAETIVLLTHQTTKGKELR